MNSAFLNQDRSLVLGYGQQAVLQVSDQEYRKGERWILTGGNGAGKSTFLRAFLEPALILSGKRDLKVTPTQIAWIPQAPRFNHQMPCSAFDFLAGSLSLLRPAWKGLSSEDWAQVRANLEQSGIEGRSLLSSLSGGQVQRLLMARALLLKAEIYLFDEPFSAVQGSSKVELIRQLDVIRDQSLQIFALHETSEIEALGGRRLRFEEGRCGL